MKLKEIMTKHFVVCSKEESAKDAAIKMKKNDIGFLPVVDGEKIIGVVTDRDIVINILTNKDINTPLESYITKHITTIDEESSINEALEMMKQHKVKRLLVTHDRKVVGIVSMADLYPHIEDSNLLLNCLQQINEISNNKAEKDAEIDEFYL